LACNIKKKRDINDYSFAHLTLTLLLHYPMKCRSHNLDVYNNEFILGSEQRKPAQKIIMRPQNHRKTVSYLTLIRSESIVPRSRDVDELKRHTDSEWPALSHTVIELLFGDWPTRLRSCWRQIF